MVNPYTIIPGQDYGQGLAGLAQSVERLGEKKVIERAKKKFETMKVDAIEAYNTKDPEIIAGFMLKNPEMAKAMEISYKFYDEETKKSYLDGIYNILSDPTEENVMKVVNDRRDLLLRKEVPEEQSQETISFAKRFMSNPTKALKKLEFDAASLDPKRYKAWKSVYRPEDEETASSNLKKHIDERQALLNKGVAKDDPRIIAYDDKISGRESTPAPSNLKKMMDERDELLKTGVDSKDPDIIAYNNKIFGEMADKKYSPSPLKKLIKERAEYLEEGYDPDSDIIRAYNNKIAGIDIDIEELTQDEIDMWGAWVNLTGKMPSVGRGKQATKIRAAILKSAAGQALGDTDKGKVPGKTPAEAALEVVGTQADTKSIQGSLNFLEKQLGSMGSFIQNMDAQITKVTALADDLYSFDARILNVPLRFVRGKIVGSPLQSKYDMYLTEIEQEIGRLAAGASASIAELSTGAQERWDRIHDKNLSVKDMLSLLKETRHAADLRLQSVEDQLNRTRVKIRTRDYGGIEIPKISSQSQYDALKSGDVYINQSTGKRMRKP